jgi:surface antigen
MRTTKVRDRSHVAWCRIGTLAVAALVASAGLLFATPVAGASGGLSSTILAEPQPGLVAATPGPYNGPLTESNVGLVLGSAAGASNALRQSLTSGDVTSYVRLWTRQPTNGDAVLILAFQFNNALLESSFLDGLDGALQGQTGGTPLAVPGIPGAAGAALQTSSSGTPVSEYVVAFAKGNTAFEINVASTSGDLTAADTIAMANSQFAAAPDIPAGTGTPWNWAGTAFFGGGVLLVIAIFVIGRVRKYPVALRGGPVYNGGYHGGLPTAGHAPPQPSWSPAGPSPSDAPTKVSTDQWP